MHHISPATQSPSPSPSPSTSTSASVAFAVGHPLILAGLLSLAASSPALALLGQAADSAAAVALHERLRPDVMLIDLHLPGGAVAAIARIRAAQPRARVIVLAGWEGEDELHRALAAGACACLLKSADLAQIVACIAAVAAGRAVLPPTLAARGARLQVDRLSPRELEILGHLSAGNSNKIIARIAGIGVGTVKYHVNNILSKLNVSCRTEAASVAIQRGLVQLH